MLKISLGDIDTDRDGIPDDKDQCPDTPSAESANAYGCSISQSDTDKDGVKDNLDQCADTLSGEQVDVNGCAESQKDSDNFLNRILNKSDYDGWTFAHFMLHLGLGYTFYPKWWISTVWGFTWEQIESKLAENDEYWVDSSEFDYLVNHAGLISGMLIRKYLPK